MGKGIFFSLATMLFSGTAFAGSIASYAEIGGVYNYSKLGFDFVAPVVASESDVPMQAGLIFYDIGAGLKVVNPNGAVETLTIDPAGGNVAGSTGANIAVVSAYVTYSGGVPSIARQDGTWISSISDTALGQSTLNITSVGFTTAPNCTCSVVSNGPGFCQFETAISSNQIVVQVRDAEGTGQDLNYHITCVGPM